jgi:hypothetical protein
VAEAVKRVRYFTDDETRRLELEAHEKWLHDQATRTEGHAEGEAARSVAVARRMLARGWDPADVAELTDLTVDQVKDLSGGHP